MERRLLNINLETGDCIQEKEISLYDSYDLESVIARMREAAEGLTDPYVEVESQGDDYGAILLVAGHRQLTQAERDKIELERKYQAAQQRHWKKFEAEMKRLGY